MSKPTGTLNLTPVNVGGDSKKSSNEGDGSDGGGNQTDINNLYNEVGGGGGGSNNNASTSSNNQNNCCPDKKQGSSVGFRNKIRPNGFGAQISGSIALFYGINLTLGLIADERGNDGLFLSVAFIQGLGVGADAGLIYVKSEKQSVPFDIYQQFEGYGDSYSFGLGPVALGVSGNKSGAFSPMSQPQEYDAIGLATRRDYNAYYVGGGLNFGAFKKYSGLAQKNLAMPNPQIRGQSLSGSASWVNRTFVWDINKFFNKIGLPLHGN